jgi:hypothetical protein
MTLPEIITVVKDVLVALAAATTAVVAVLGLRKWRQELEGKAQFEVARNLIRATYRLRDEIRNCRSPFYSAYEFPEDYKGGLAQHSGEEEARAWMHIYKNRWTPVWTALQEFDSHTLEAEALWGSAIRTKTDALRECVRDLNAAIDAVIRDKASGGEDFKDREFGKQMRSIVAASADDDKNVINRKMGKAISGIEDELRPHLRRS